MSEFIFVERRFELDGNGLIVRFYLPTPEPGGEYRCRWTIGWPGSEEQRSARGIDGVQALLLAMRSVHSQLVASDAYRTGKLTYLDGNDLDLPSHFLSEDS